uniref:hypothetical protein n=1 Tax=Sulfurihydrogenibium sp. TaxID=2053621 RepID=UPI00263232DA
LSFYLPPILFDYFIKVDAHCLYEPIHTVDYTEEEPITRRITTYEGENQESDIFSEYYQGG